MIVVDVNTIAYLWIPGEMSALAEKALERDPHWVAPVLWRSELLNVLAGYFRRGDLNRESMGRCLHAAESQLAGYEFLVPTNLVMDKIEASSCSAYDCEYVALADDLNVMLVTSDLKILKNFPDLAISLHAFTSSE